LFIASVGGVVGLVEIPWHRQSLLLTNPNQAMMLLRGGLERNVGMSKLKRILFDEYGGFADKRIKKLEKGNLFIVDDRTESDCAADKSLFLWFATLFVESVSDDELKLHAGGAFPNGADVRRWLKVNRITTSEGHRLFSATLTPKNYSILDTLPHAVAKIVERGAPPYEVKAYKYVCPRTAKSLTRLSNTLKKAWPDEKQIAMSGLRIY
jgi:hypothetical protein